MADPDVPNPHSLYLAEPMPAFDPDLYPPPFQSETETNPEQERIDPSRFLHTSQCEDVESSLVTIAKVLDFLGRVAQFKTEDLLKFIPKCFAYTSKLRSNCLDEMYRFERFVDEFRPVGMYTYLGAESVLDGNMMHKALRSVGAFADKMDEIAGYMHGCIKRGLEYGPLTTASTRDAVAIVNELKTSVEVHLSYWRKIKDLESKEIHDMTEFKRNFELEMSQ
jgi:hypothetical protein